jgi:hypothetical protein
VKKIILYLLILLPASLSAQTIKGKVIDEITGKGVAYVSIGVLGTNRATVSNDDGEFIFQKVELPTNLKFSHVSYLNLSYQIKVETDQLIIKLKPAAINLSTVNITTDRGLTILRSALQLAKDHDQSFFYGKAFYRQLTTTNDQANGIHEVFYDIRWNVNRIDGVIAKQSRYAELRAPNMIQINNQSSFTFSLAGYLFPPVDGQFINLLNLDKFNISVEGYIEKEDQDIIIISCLLKKTNKQVYINSKYFIGTKNSKIYKLENEIFNVKLRLGGATKEVTPSIINTISMFSETSLPFNVLDNIVFTANIHQERKGVEMKGTIKSMLNVYNIITNYESLDFEPVKQRSNDRKKITEMKYNPEIWLNNPMVRKTVIEDSFIKLMESKSAFGSMTNP